MHFFSNVKDVNKILLLLMFFSLSTSLCGLSLSRHQFSMECHKQNIHKNVEIYICLSILDMQDLCNISESGNPAPQ